MINKDPNHKHTYDAQGRMTCCTQEDKIYTKAGAKELLPHGHTHDDGHDHDPDRLPTNRGRRLRGGHAAGD